MQNLAILIDVDGVLNPDIKHHVKYCKCHPGWTRRRDITRIYKLNLNPGHGRMLRNLAAEFDAELLWFTTWEKEANWEIAPYIGLKALPVIPCPIRPDGSTLSYGDWKAHLAAAWANETRRPFIWFDDEPGAGDTLGAMTEVPHLVVAVDERIGLNDEHIQQARAWLQQQTSIPSRPG